MYECKIGYRDSVCQEHLLKKKLNGLQINTSKTIKSVNEEISNLHNQLSKQITAFTDLEKEKKQAET